jgi:hypothetical protein
MLDKGQIKDWEGEPEDKKPETKEAPQRSPVASALFDGREALPTGERVTLTPEQVTARKKRSQWLAIALFAFVIIIFVLTMTKIGANVLVRDL